MMNNAPSTLRVGYVVKMFPRLSETFILNEILQLEEYGVEVVIFSLKKPNEGRFHPQVSRLKAQVFYLEDLDVKKWSSWLRKEWSVLAPFQDNLWRLLSEALSGDGRIKVDDIWLAAWVAATAQRLGLSRLHAHFASHPSTMAYYAHRISSIPFSFTAHAKDIYVYTMDEHLLRDKLATATPTVTVTNFNRRYLLEQAPEIDPDRIKVLHNGINLKQFRYDKSIQRHPRSILAVGRMVIKKGFADLLRACHLLKTRNIPFECTLVGDGPELENLQSLQSELGLEQEVSFVGAKNLDEVMQLMRTATLFCLPCTTAPDNNVDALPTVLLEALACGLPVISTTVSGVPEIIDSGVDGLLAPPDDPDALTKAIFELLMSGEQRDRFAENGRKKAELKFDLRKNVATLMQLFQSELADGVNPTLSSTESTGG